MALVVEDGSGLSTANGYVSTSFADTYHDDRGNTAWADATTTQKEVAIVKASTYVDSRFGTRFRGWRKQKDQALEWPRIDAFSDDGYAYDGLDVVPRTLQKAISEYALVALSADLAPAPTDAGASSGVLIDSRDKVGPIETLRKYDASSFPGRSEGPVPGALLPVHPQADLLIRELIKSRASTDVFRA